MEQEKAKEALMNEKTKTWRMAAGAAAALAFAALICFLHPGIVKQAGIDGNDLGGGVLAALIVCLVLGVTVGAGLLLGFAVFFMA
jgi:hypothetical protein